MYVILVMGILAVKRIFFCRKVSADLMKPQIVMRNSRHHEGFYCLSSYEKTEELGSKISS